MTTAAYHTPEIETAANALRNAFKTAYVRRNAERIAAIVLGPAHRPPAEQLRYELQTTLASGARGPVVYVDRNAEALVACVRAAVAR